MISRLMLRTISMTLSRRSALMTLAGMALGAGLALPASALEPDTATAHVESAIDEIVDLMVSRKPDTDVSAELLVIMQNRLALPAVSRFVLGPTWREISEDQRARFTQAFSASVARTYGRRFTELEGDVSRETIREVIFITGTRDAGRKGVLVETEIRPPGFPLIEMDYLVSDRGGRTAIVDMVIQGVSLAVTQRDVVGGMLSNRGGDVEQLILDLDKF